MRFRGALFDMDGLLLDTERLHFEAGAAAARELGLGDLSAALRSMIGVRALEGRALLEPALRDRVTLGEFEAAWSVEMERLVVRGVPVRRNVVELLTLLRGRGTPCAVATSSRRASAEAALSEANLRGFFRTVTGGDDVVNAKPDPEIYVRAAASLGIEPRDAVAFEDSGPGTRAAVASGATVVQVPDLVAPSAALLVLGHVVAPDVLAGARRVGLVT